MIYDPLVSPAVTPSDKHPDSYWQATCSPISCAALEKDLNVDTLVIGAGYTGLAAATELAALGIETVLIDSHEPGFGCAGRNGGFVLSGTGRLSVADIENQWGSDIARGMNKEFDRAVDFLLSRIGDANIDCDLVAGPYYKMAHNPKKAARLEASLDYMQKHFAVGGQYLKPAQLQAELNSAQTYGAVKTPGHALNPLKLVDGLTRLARQSGVYLFHRTPALAINKEPAGYVVSTPKGVIRARHLLLATNAYSPRQFHPVVNKKQFPVQSSILVTAPLTEEQKAATGLDRPMTMMDTRMMKYYYRVLPDGRLLFGGRGAVTGKNGQSHASQARLYKGMTGAFKALEGIKQDYFWSGWVSVSLDNLPRIRYNTDDKLGYAMGYCGSGVSFATWAGYRLARQRSGDTTHCHLPLYNSDLPTFPLAPLRRLALWGMYTAAGFIDL